MTSPSREELLKIIDAGIRAPSADNRHHVCFEITDETLRIWGDQEFLGETQAHRRILTLISIGAIIENVALRAAALGFLCEFGAFLDPSRPGLLVEIRWKKSPANADELNEAIELRHTNRRFYRGSKLNPQYLEVLDAEANHIAGVRLIWLDGDARRKALRLISMAEAERFRSWPLHKELFSAIRFDVGWKQTCEEGLPPGALEVEPFLRGAFAALRSWRLMRVLNALGTARALGVRAAYMPCRMSPHLGIIGTRLELNQGAIAVGRALERLWLRATLAGLAIQPMAASVVLPLQSSAAEGASDCVRSTLRVGWREISPGIIPLMIFRLGRAKAPSVRTSRKDIASYLCGDDGVLRGHRVQPRAS